MKRQLGITYRNGQWTPFYESRSMVFARVAAFGMMAFVLAAIVVMLALL